MAREKIISALDVGTQQVRAVIAQVRPTSAEHPEQKPQILGVGQAPSAGVRKGLVVDLNETAESIRKAVANCQRSSGFSFGSAYVSVGGSQINSRESRGVVAVSRADNEISQEDTERAINAASAVSLPQNREILHILPRRYIVDDEPAIKDPVGMHGVRLEVDTLIIEVADPYWKNLNKAVQEAGVRVKDWVLAPLASALAVVSRRQKELGVLVLDMGGGTCGLTVFEEGDIIHSHVLPIGSSHITNDIAIGLRTSVDVAEKIKVEYGSTLPSEISKKEIIDLAKLGDEDIRVPRKKLAEIIEARVDEILDLVNKELKKIDRQGLLPGGVVLVGGGAKLPGLVDFTKEKLGLPAQIGFPQEIEGVVDQIDDPVFANVCGLIFWGIRDYQIDGVGRISQIGAGLWQKIKRLFRSFLP